MSKQNSGLPSTWHEVGNPPLYWRRQNTGYEVWPEYGRFRARLDGEVITSDAHDNLTHAIVACREHMHEHGNYPGEHWQK